MQATAIWPLDVTLNQATGRVDVLWSDGQLGRLGGTLLRGACRCAACESGRRAGQPPAAAADAAVTELQPIGEMGLQLTFNDGHDRGIYPWSYLHELSVIERAFVAQ
ncbi:MAG TPA: gamma-butyrobetaine hydroxylase-like domain-containing protein [Ramlibacter sp.]|nr:gamma-butyrobetaine hydroxylase-like domain-containing protein [Ramlibacter sp.]